VNVFFITHWFPTANQPSYGIFILEHARAVARTHTVTLLHILGVDPTLKQPIQILPTENYPGIMVYQLSYLHPKVPYTTWIRRIMGAMQVFEMASEKYGHPNIIHANVNNTADGGGAGASGECTGGAQRAQQ
jgi:hypothetical protein